MVMPRSRSSGALSIWSYARNVAPPDFASTFVMAAVSDVLPWSTCPIVPMFTWGLFLSNFSLAIASPRLRSPNPLALLDLAHHPGDDLLAHVLGGLGVLLELHRVGGPALR